MPKLTSRGSITIPIKVRSELGLRAGDRIDFLEKEKGEFVIVPVTQSVKDLNGMFRGRRSKPVSFESMDAAIAKGAASRSR
jgi:antitoxin PrlF